MISLLSRNFSKNIFIFLIVLSINILIFPGNVASQNTSTETKPTKISFENSVTRDNLKARFQSFLDKSTSTKDQMIKGQREGKIKILVVPGHDNEYYGAQSGNFREADLNLKIAGYLKNLLEKEPAFEVYTTRDSKFIKNETENNQDKNGYTDYFQKYLDENISKVLDYKNLYKVATENRLNSNSKTYSKKVEHVSAPGEMSYRLYAINKFIEDNKIDIAIHIHLNDYAGRNNENGQYKGFSIYVPDNTLRNGKQSQELAKYIAKSLDDDFKYSNNPIEKDRIILGNELIANGSNNTIQAASVLIEYGYIYEKQFQKDDTLKKAAEQTYLGIKNFFTRK